MNLLISGADGQLGQALQQQAAKLGNIDTVTAFNRQSFDLTDSARCRHILRKLKPDALINAGAYTAVDKAESEPETANRINGDSVGVLAKACRELDCRFIHVSTDYVFNGCGHRPYRPDDPVDPINAYGAGKALGEHLALKNNDQSVIVRTAWVYAATGRNFVNTMLRLMAEKPQLNVVCDQIGTPTWATSLADCLLQLTDRADLTGIYHYTDAGVASWYDFAKAIQTLSSQSRVKTCDIRPCDSSAFPTPARRPSFSLLDKSRLYHDLNLTPVYWRDALSRMLEELECPNVS